MCGASKTRKRIALSGVNREVNTTKMGPKDDFADDRVGAIPATRVRFAMKQAGNRVGVVLTDSVD